VLINGPEHVAPLAGDLHVGLVDIPTVADRAPTGHGRIREEWREALDPPVDGDVVDVDPTLTEQLLDIAIGQPIPQVPAHGEDDDLGREPETLEPQLGTTGIGRERRDLIPTRSPPTALVRTNPRIAVRTNRPLNVGQVSGRRRAGSMQQCPPTGVVDTGGLAETIG
jgi:hypothetical protein